MSHAVFSRPICRAMTALLAVLAVFTGAARAQPLPPEDPQDGKTFRALVFHNIRLDAFQTFKGDTDDLARYLDDSIDASVLTGVFDWLRRNGYHPISLQQAIDARTGGAPLPARPVLLTFDDGYTSFYTRAYPLLKLYNYPAMLALMTGWMETAPGKAVSYGNVTLPREQFMTWAQAREVAQSGLVELVSHSHGLHHGIPANPQGNVQPAAVTHAWDQAAGRYETDDEYMQRVEQDLRQSKALIEANTGQRVRAIAWPYGASNALAAAAAERAGMPYGFTMSDGPVNGQQPISQMSRSYASRNLTVTDYESLLRSLPLSASALGTQRIVHVDLDYIYDPDQLQQERNLSALIERIHAIGPSAVYLQAFADPDGTGAAKALYFPNRHLPMRADLFNRAAWQLRTRAGVRVFAWMPVLAFELPGVTVQAHGATASASGASPRYRRLSVFDQQARQAIREIYDDLGRHASFAGVLFHDDAFLGDDEDVSAPALAAYASWGLPGGVDVIRADADLRARWAVGKTRALTDFTLELAQILRRWQPELLTARNFYARPVLDPAAREWFAQDLAGDLARYDYSVIMAMPAMEQASDAQAWLRQLALAALAAPDAAGHTVFELQARDWRTSQPVPDTQLQQQALLLRRLGARHLAYYPDDAKAGQPGLATARANFSTGYLIENELRRELAPANKPSARRQADAASQVGSMP